MKKASDREELMIRYLLGQLPEKEQLRVEEQFFTDEESYQQLLALEDELRYDYVTGELVGSEREQFKERFLVTPEDRKKVAFAGALVSKVATPATVKPTPSKPITWWQQLASLLNVQNPVVRYSFAAALLVVLLGAVWLISQRVRNDRPKELAGREQPQLRPDKVDGKTNEVPKSDENRPTPPEEVVVEQRPLQPPSKREEPPVFSVATFVLTPGLTRGAGTPKELVIEGNTNRVRLQLSLKRTSEHRSYRAVLRTLEGVEVWNRSGLPARPASSGQAIILQLPTTLLAAGDYELALQGMTPSGSYEDVDEYYFRIVKK